MNNSKADGKLLINVFKAHDLEKCSLGKKKKQSPLTLSFEEKPLLSLILSHALLLLSTLHSLTLTEGLSEATHMSKDAQANK